MSKVKEISIGFKLTKIGALPIDWDVKLLDQISKRGSGHTPNKNVSSNYNGGIKWVSLADSSKLDNGLISNTTIEISLEGIKNSSAVLHKKGTVLLSRDAGVGKSAIMGEEMAVSQHFITWTCDNLLSNWYLYYYLQFKKGLFERMAVGSTIKTIGLPFFKKFQIPYPPLPEQQKIAEILSTWDQAIATTKKLINELKLRKKGLAQQLLTGKKRLKGYEGEWEKFKIGKLLIESRIPSESPDTSRRISVRLKLKGIEKRDEKVTDSNSTAYFIRSAGQFIYGKQNLHKGALGIIPDQLDGFETTQDIPTFDFTDKVHPFWFLNFIGRESFYSQLESIATGTGSKRIHPKSLFKIEITIPSIEEQKAIAAVFSEVDKELKLYQQQLYTLKEQKKGLMQKLLTGEIRVKTD